MTKLRTTITLGVVVVAAIGAGASLYVVNKVSAEAARALIAVQAGTLVALAITVVVLFAATLKRIDELVEALRALARGEKHTRVDASTFAGLADIARGVNEVAASLCENDDPNLGPIQKRVRERPPVVEAEARKSKSDPPQPRPRIPSPTAPRGLANDLSDHPEIGEVRVRRKPARTEKSEKSEKIEKPSEKSEKPASAPPATETVTPSASTTTDAALAPTVLPEPASLLAPPVAGSDGNGSGNSNSNGNSSGNGVTAAADAAANGEHASQPPRGPTGEHANGTAENAEEAAAKAGSTDDDGEDDRGNDTVIEAADSEPQLPGTLELQALFAEFVKEKKAAGQGDVDVDFAAFEETILGECQRLLAEHGCRGVRFEVAVGDGDVSLRPRLLR